MKVIIIIILIYIGLRIFVKYIFPVLLGSYINKKMTEMHRHQQSRQQYNQNRQGNVTIDPSTSNKKKYSKDEGEYIDFEEVK